MKTRAVNDNADEGCRHAILPLFETMIVAALNSGWSEKQIALAIAQLAEANFEKVSGMDIQ